MTTTQDIESAPKEVVRGTPNGAKRFAGVSGLRLTLYTLCGAALSMALFGMLISANFIATEFAVSNTVKSTVVVVNVSDGQSGKIEESSFLLNNAQGKSVGAGEIVKVGDATVDMPLAVAPLLRLELLNSIKSLYITRPDCADPDSNTTEVHESFATESYTITGYTKKSSSALAFHTTRGHMIVLDQGEATVVDNEGAEYPVCFADVTCSAFRMTDFDEAKALMEQVRAMYPSVYGTADASADGSRQNRLLVETHMRDLFGSANPANLFTGGGSNGMCYSIGCLSSGAKYGANKVSGWLSMHGKNIGMGILNAITSLLEDMLLSLTEASCSALTGFMHTQLAQIGEQCIDPLNMCGLDLAEKTFELIGGADDGDQTIAPFECDEGFYKDAAGSGHICRRDDDSGHWTCPASGWVTGTAPDYCTPDPDYVQPYLTLGTQNTLQACFQIETVQFNCGALTDNLQPIIRGWIDDAITQPIQSAALAAVSFRRRALAELESTPHEHFEKRKGELISSAFEEAKQKLMEKLAKQLFEEDQRRRLQSNANAANFAMEGISMRFSFEAQSTVTANAQYALDERYEVDLLADADGKPFRPLDLSAKMGVPLTMGMVVMSFEAGFEMSMPLAMHATATAQGIASATAHYKREVRVILTPSGVTHHELARIEEVSFEAGAGMSASLSISLGLAAKASLGVEMTIGTTINFFAEAEALWEAKIGADGVACPLDSWATSTPPDFMCDNMHTRLTPYVEYPKSSVSNVGAGSWGMGYWAYVSAPQVLVSGGLRFPGDSFLERCAGMPNFEMGWASSFGSTPSDGLGGIAHPYGGLLFRTAQITTGCVPTGIFIGGCSASVSPPHSAWPPAPVIIDSSPGGQAVEENPAYVGSHLGLCQGDCDRNMDCGFGLVCHQRGMDDPLTVPGCLGEAGTRALDGVPSTYDYCVPFDTSASPGLTQSAFQGVGVAVLDGESGEMMECVTDPTATTTAVASVGTSTVSGHTTIAAQCCTADDACVRYVDTNDDAGCIAGHQSGNSGDDLRPSTYSEAHAECASRGLQLCEQSCSTTGCGYNAHPVWTRTPCTVTG